MIASTLRFCGHMKHWNCVLTTNNIGDIVGFGNQTRAYAKKENDSPERIKIAACAKEISQTEGRSVEPWPKSDPPPPAWRCECPQGPQPPNYDPYRIKVPDVVVPPLPASNAKPMLDCARTRGPCSVRAPDPPACPPPPRKPFDWTYVIATSLLLALVGAFYRWYVYREELETNIPIWRPRLKKKRPYHDKDLPACVQYLIVGTGAAGWAAYRAIMQHDKTAKVFFITKEDCMPYLRPPMSKLMWWNAEPPDLRTLSYIDHGKRLTMYLAQCKDFLDPVKFYRKKVGPAVSIAAGWCVLRVDADDHVAYVKTMCGETPIYYERCLLAVGAKPKNLTVFKTAPREVRDRVCTLRTVRDLEVAHRRVRDARHITIVGGGFLGTELAWHLGRMHKEWYPPPDEGYVPPKVVHLLKDKGILANILPEYLSEWAAERLKCQTVTVTPKTQVYDAFMSPDGRLELTLSNGTSMVTDYVFVCVGTSPREELAAPSFLELDPVNGGFLVNTELEARTHLYVAGDAASFYSQWKGERMRLEHYTNAAEQGVIAGQNMAGYWTPCNMEPYARLQLGTDFNMEVIGEVGACMPTIGLFKPCAAADDPRGRALEIKAGEYERPCYKESESYRNRYKRGMLFYLRDATVVGMLFWNFPPIEDRKEVVTEMLRARPTYRDINVLAELLGYADMQCVYIPEEIVAEGPCIKNWKFPPENYCCN